jgi:hypothetical protein
MGDFFYLCVMGVVYIKMIYSENGVSYTKQKVCTVLSEDQHGNLTVRLFNEEHNDHEIRVLREDQYSRTPFLMDFS